MQLRRALTAAQQRAALAALAAAERPLQRVLWDRGFWYSLKPHQFVGARFAAGLATTSAAGANWPEQYPPAVWPDPASLDEGGGGILADVMGLGKVPFVRV